MTRVEAVIQLRCWKVEVRGTSPRFLLLGYDAQSSQTESTHINTRINTDEPEGSSYAPPPLLTSIFTAAEYSNCMLLHCFFISSSKKSISYQPASG